MDFDISTTHSTLSVPLEKQNILDSFADKIAKGKLVLLHTLDMTCLTRRGLVAFGFGKVLATTCKIGLKEFLVVCVTEPLKR